MEINNAKNLKEKDFRCSCSSCTTSKTESDESKKFEIIRLLISILFFLVGIFFWNYSDKRFLFSISLPALFFIFTWFISGFEVLSNAVKNLFKGEVFDENFLMTVASIGALILEEYFEGATVMLLYNIGELIQDYAVDSSRSSISKLLDLQVDQVRIIDEGNEKMVSPETVKIGSIVLVKPGEKIPIDGIIQNGNALVETASLTGESLPSAFGIGDKVLSGFISLDGVLEIKTSSVFSESAASKVEALISNAQNQKAKPEKFITRFARIYTPIVTLAAIFIAIIPPLILSAINKVAITGFESFGSWIYRGLIFLTVSCPCALVISVPLTYFASLGGLAKKGILSKGANFIDSLANVETCVFDKTGTLTEGNLSVFEIITKNNFTEVEVLSLAYEAEKNSTHPIAKAVIEKAKTENLHNTNSKYSVKNFLEIPGKGVKLEVNEKYLLVGNQKIFEYTNDNLQNKIQKTTAGKTLVYVIYDSKLAGCIYFNDQLRKTSIGLVEKLNALNVKKTVILTGDNYAEAEKIANTLRVTEFDANLLPEQKLERLKNIIAKTRASTKKGRVCFLGDGINDAPALSLADIGISFGNFSSDIAIESADVIFLTENLSLLPTAIEHSKKTSKLVAQNITFAISVKVLFLILGAFGLIGMISAIFADVGVCLIAILNSLRARN